MATEPKIFSKNYIISDNGYSLSHGGDSKYLYDYDPLSKLLTTGANNDATTFSMIVNFYEGSVACSRTIDTVFILNHNLKTWELFYWNDDTSAWVSLTSETADDVANTIKTFTSATTTKIKLECTATQVANAEKYIGDMVVGALYLDVGEDMATYQPKYREKKTDLTLGDGAAHQIITRFSPYRTQKYGAHVVFDTVSQAVYDSLKTLKETGMPFIWQPESVSRPEVVHLVQWTNAFDPPYAIPSIKTSGYKITLELMEV